MLIVISHPRSKYYDQFSERVILSWNTEVELTC